MIVLDTHIWFRWVTAAEPLPDIVSSMIEGTEVAGVSAISVWEIARLALRGRVDVKRDISTWLRFALAGAGVGCIPVTDAIALRTACCPKFTAIPPTVRSSRPLSNTTPSRSASMSSFLFSTSSQDDSSARTV